MTHTPGQLGIAPMQSHCRPGGPCRCIGCILLFASLLLFGACETSDQGHGDGVTSGQFQDVVVPTGFRLRDAAHESFSREEAGWRQGHFVYLGAVKIEEALGYVRQRMSQHSWTMVAEGAVDEAGTLLRFERGVYSADYTFLRRDGSTEMVVDYATNYSRR